MSVKISVVTVCYNSEKTIEETINSVLAQSYDNVEYIIVDGLSSDCTLEKIKSFSEAFAVKGYEYIYISEKDNGIYDAMNKGIGLTSGELIGIINSDDYYEPGALEKVAKFYEENNFDLMYADLRIFDKRKSFIKRSKKTKRFNTRYWNHPTTFVKREVYNERRYACESIYDDLDFMLQVMKHGYKVMILNEVLANFRLGGVSNENSFKKMRQRLALKNSIYKKHGYKHYRFSNFVMEFAKYVLIR